MTKMILKTRGNCSSIYEFYGERNIQIGRAQENDIIFDDGKVSCRHCEIQLVDNDAKIRDLGSLNSTRIIRENRSYMLGGRLKDTKRADSEQHYSDFFALEDGDIIKLCSDCYIDVEISDHIF